MAPTTGGDGLTLRRSRAERLLARAEKGEKVIVKGGRLLLLRLELIWRRNTGTAQHSRSLTRRGV